MDGEYCNLSPGGHTYDSVTIQSGGTVIAEGDLDTNSGVTLISDALTIEAGGVLSADGQGFPIGQGPGAGGVDDHHTGGGGHGGYGGNANRPGAYGGDSYGSYDHPITLGSGAGNYAGSQPGGGAIHLVVDGTVQIDGSINANGLSATDAERGGGGGGSLWIQAAALTGTGQIEANGGQGGSQGGGGSGGRIAIDVESVDFEGDTSAYGGTGYQAGGPGTLYWAAAQHLIIDNHDHAGRAATIEAEFYPFQRVDLNNAGHLDALDPNAALQTGIIHGDGSASLMSYGIIEGSESLTLDEYSLDVRGRLLGVRDLTLRSFIRLTLRADTPLHIGSYEFDHLALEDQSALHLVPAENGDEDYGNDAPFRLNVDTLVVGASASVSADGYGYPGGYYAGLGPGAGDGPDGTLGYEAGGGGGYGGRGGDTEGQVGGETYGDLYQPLDLGSGAGGGLAVTRRFYGGSGGGAIRIVATESVQIDGEISADGDSGPGQNKYGIMCGGGGGSGGSIWITAPVVSGSGLLSAVGGAADYGGGGGGGRIAVEAEQVSLDLTYAYQGGAGYYNDGQPGTLYLGDLDASTSTVEIEPAQVPTDGVSTATIIVTLKNEHGTPLPDQPVEVALAYGDTAFINGAGLEMNEFAAIGNTDANGRATASMRAESIGMRTIQARSSQVLLLDQGTVEFIPGPISASLSSLSANASRAAADGDSLITVTATMRDSYGNPIPEVQVILSAGGSAQVAGPEAPTDLQGQASGRVTDSVVEVVTVTAVADGVDLEQQVSLDFRGANLVVDLDAPGEAPVGGNMTYDLKVENRDLLTAQDLTLSLELGPELSLVSHNAPSAPAQSENTLTWSLDPLAHGQAVAFSATTQISVTTEFGSQVSSNLIATSSATEMDPADNNDSAATYARDPRRFEASLFPNATTLNLGGAAQYQVRVQNTGWLSDSYTFALNGLDPGWVSWSQEQLPLAAGASGDVTLSIEPPGCEAESSLPFTVQVTSVGNAVDQDLAAEVTLEQSPLITMDTPADGATSGSRSVLFRWRTQPATTGELSLHPVDDPGAVQTFETELGTAHSVLAPDLARYHTYQWQVGAESTCGSASSTERSLTIGSGIVFTQHDPSFEIERDYDQRLQLTVRNDDSVAHSLLATVLNPHLDLFINFVGSGSVDEQITLAAGESRSLDLAAHAQDTLERNYELVVEITADEGGEELKDAATLHLRVLADFDVEIEEISADPVTGTRSMRVTNRGRTLSDLHIQAVDPQTGEPARVFLKPSITHARLGTDRSLTFQMLPLFDERDVEGASPETFAAKPWLLEGTPGEIPAELVVSGAGQSQPYAADMGCSSGAVYAVTLEDVCLPVPAEDWYCTNRPEIALDLTTPYFLDANGLRSLDLQMSFDPRSNVRPHTTSFSFNGAVLGSLGDMVPEGSYATHIPTLAFNVGAAGPVNQRLELNSQHENGGHYVVATDFILGVGMKSVTGYVCAGSQSQARQSLIDSYGFEPLTESSACHAYFVRDDAVQSNANDQCMGAALQGTQAMRGGPINTRTGGYDYSVVDLSLPTAAGPLTFQRWYSSLGIDTYDDVLGPGWTHSLDSRLIFPSDPGGREGVVLLKSHSANLYEFEVNADGTYSTFPGVCGKLTRDEGPPVRYTLTDNSQRSYTFDVSGRLMRLEDAQGRGLNYRYDGEGLLARVDDDGSARWLAFSYDASGRMLSVSDQSGREVRFSYDPAAGDLASVRDLMGHVWTYAYDAQHHLIQVRDPLDEIVERTEYDGQGRAVRQYNAEGLVLELEYHGFGVTRVVDGLGHEESLTYNGMNALDRQKDPGGGQQSQVYDDNFRPTQVTDSGGAVTRMAWSADGANLEQVTDPLGHQTEMAYDENHNLTGVTDALGRTSSYTYDGALLTTSIDALGNVTRYTYTPEGFLESVTDPLGRITSYSYDEFGQRTAMTDALGHTTKYRYDDLGRLAEIEDSLGRITRSEYDAAGRVLKRIANVDPVRPQNDESQYNLTTEYEYDALGRLVAVIDTDGNRSEFEYDSAGRLARSTDPQGNVTGYRYDANGNLIETTDPLRRITTFAYDENNRLVSTTDPLGHTTTTAYNADGATASVTDALGHITRYEYDALKRVVALVDSLGGRSTTEYDNVGNVISRIDPLGHTTRYEYDELNRLVREIDPLGGVSAHTYDAVGNRLSTTDPNGNVTTFEYDALNRLFASIDALGNRTTYAYDEAGNRESVTNPLGNSTTFEYDLLDRLIASTDPLGAVTRTSYDPLGNPLARTDAKDHTSTYAYDNLGRLTQQTDPLGSVTQFAYDVVGNRTGVTDALGHTRTRCFDALNRAVTVTDPLGNTRQMQYDAVGNLVTSIDPLGGETRYEYDALNRQIAITDPLGNRTEFSYDAAGNRISQRDSLGVVTHYTYDALGRLTAVVENYRPALVADHETNVRTEYAYDANGNRYVVRNANGHETLYAFDALDRLVRETDPLGNVTEYNYDAAGNRVALTDAAGSTIGYSYDAAQRLIGIDYPDPDADVTFAYDSVGNRLEMQDGMGETAWTYDALGRVTAVEDPFDDMISYSYDALGQRTGLTYPDGKAVAYNYDPAGRMLAVEAWDGARTNYSYDANGRPVGVDLPNGVHSSYAYNAAGWLTGVGHSAGYGVLSSFAYSYDANGNRVAVLESLRTAGALDAAVYFADDGEMGPWGWEAGGDWALDESGSQSPTHAWSLNPAGEAQSSTDQSLTLIKPVEIPADAEQPALVFSHQFDPASDSRLRVEIRAEAGEWELLKTYNGASALAFAAPLAADAWQYQRLDLGAYRGRSLYVRFRAVQGGSSTSDTWRIDDVLLGEAPENLIFFPLLFKDHAISPLSRAASAADVTPSATLTLVESPTATPSGTPTPTASRTTLASPTFTPSASWTPQASPSATGTDLHPDAASAGSFANHFAVAIADADARAHAGRVCCGRRQSPRVVFTGELAVGSCAAGRSGRNSAPGNRLRL